MTSVPQAGPLGGVVCREHLPEAQRQETYALLVGDAIRLARDLRCLSLSIITNPFSPDHTFYEHAAPPHFTLENFCQVIDVPRLAYSADGIDTGKASHNNDIRRNLKKAANHGITIAWGGSGEFAEWYEIHRQRNIDLKTEPLDRVFLQRASEQLSAIGKGGLAVALAQGKMIGGCLFFWHHRIGDVFILSSRTSELATGVNYAITSFGLQQLGGKGIEFLNWQSCQRGSGVYLFKQRWGSVEKEYRFLTWAFDGFDRLFDVPENELRESFRWHYVAPFAAIQSRARSGVYRK